MTEALAQAKKARFEILDVIEETIPEVRPELAPTARKLIPSRLMLIRSRLSSVKVEKPLIKLSLKQALRLISTKKEMYLSTLVTKMLSTVPKKSLLVWFVKAKVDEVYHAKVVRIEKFGAFVNLFDKTDALVHISEMAWTRTNRVEDLVAIGDEVDVKVIKIDEKGRIDASMKVLLPRPPKPEHDEKR